MAQMLCLEEWIPSLGPRPLRPDTETELRPQEGHTPICLPPELYSAPGPGPASRGPQGVTPPQVGVLSDKMLKPPAAHSAEILGPCKPFRGPETGLHRVRTGVSHGLW